MKAALLWIAAPLLFAQSGGVIEGTASNKVTHAGVGGVAIKLAAASAPGKQLHVAKSDAAGAFRIEGVTEGDYVASFDAPAGFAISRPPSIDSNRGECRTQPCALRDR
jgi:hypothetical protein